MDSSLKLQSHYSGVRLGFGLRWDDFGSDFLQCDGIPLVLTLIRSHPSVTQKPSVRQSSVSVALWWRYVLNAPLGVTAATGKHKHTHARTHGCIVHTPNAHAKKPYKQHEKTIRMKRGHEERDESLQKNQEQKKPAETGDKY